MSSEDDQFESIRYDLLHFREIAIELLDRKQFRLIHMSRDGFQNRQIQLSQLASEIKV